MKSPIVTPCALLGIFLLTGVSDGSAQTGDDLLRVPWGTGLEQMRDRYGLVPVDSDSVCTRYSSRIARVDGAKVEECILEFRRRNFAGAAALTRGKTNSRALLASLVRVFGRGKAENPRAIQWLTEATHAFYDEDSDGDGYVYWYSRTSFADLAPERAVIRRNPPKQIDHR